MSCAKAASSPALSLPVKGSAPAGKRHHVKSRRRQDRNSECERQTSHGSVAKPRFHYGGTRRDPLNLANDDDGSIDRLVDSCSSNNPVVIGSVLSAEAVGSAQNPRPLSLSIPTNTKDPLNLSATDDDALSPIGGRRSRKKRRRGSFRLHHHHTSPKKMRPVDTASSSFQQSLSDSETRDTDIATTSKSTCRRRRHRCISEGDPTLLSPMSVTDQKTTPTSETAQLPIPEAVMETEAAAPVPPEVGSQPSPSPKPTFKAPVSKSAAKKERFRYGNYDRYYGKRLSEDGDIRFEHLKHEWFANKHVLDVGCNVGIVTAFIAKQLGAASVVGLDIDQKLIGLARKQLYENVDHSKAANAAKYPRSFAQLYGPVSTSKSAETGDRDVPTSSFPSNCKFLVGNYVVPDAELSLCKPQYDVILVLSVSKWIHLNWGDEGLKRLFRRAFLELKPGGKLVLEPQAFEGYKKRSNLTPDMIETYRNIKFFPSQFTDYLLRTVGFANCVLVGSPEHKAKGFRRPIYVYSKAEQSG